MNQREIETAILEEIRKSGTLRREFEDYLERIAADWRKLAPVDTGTYRKSIKVKKAGGRLGDVTQGAPIGSVYSDDDPDKVAAIEYGTSDTKEFAPMRKTAAAFNR
jgi:hypothetical protein